MIRWVKYSKDDEVEYTDYVGRETAEGCFYMCDLETRKRVKRFLDSKERFFEYKQKGWGRVTMLKETRS